DGFERAVAKLPGATLTMVYSTTELLADVRARIASSPALRGRVRLAGEVAHDRLPAFYSAADIFVIGSHHEGSGYALMEGMACGAVPVVTDIPTFRLITGPTRSLWTPGDASGCARMLVDVSGASGAASQDLDATRQRVIDHFNRELSWEAVGKRAIEIYRSI